MSPEKTNVLSSSVSVMLQAPIMCPATEKTAAILLSTITDILGCIIVKRGSTASASFTVYRGSAFSCFE
ncbi:hypothetical protein D3C85_1094970 [compost metagenome]